MPELAVYPDWQTEQSVDDVWQVAQFAAEQVFELHNVPERLNPATHVTHDDGVVHFTQFGSLRVFEKQLPELAVYPDWQTEQSVDDV